MILAKITGIEMTVASAGEPLYGKSGNFIIADKQDSNIPDWESYTRTVLRTRLLPGGRMFYFQEPPVLDLLQITTGLTPPPGATLADWERAILNEQSKVTSVDLELLAQRVAAILQERRSK